MAEAFLSRARCAGEISGPVVVIPAPSVAVGVSASAPAANAGRSGDSRLKLTEESLDVGVLRALWQALRAAVRSQEIKKTAGGLRWTAVRGDLGKCDVAR